MSTILMANLILIPKDKSKNVLVSFTVRYHLLICLYADVIRKIRLLGADIARV
jgi:hypothetical protein